MSQTSVPGNFLRLIAIIAQLVSACSQGTDGANPPDPELRLDDGAEVRLVAKAFSLRPESDLFPMLMNPGGSQNDGERLELCVSKIELDGKGKIDHFHYGQYVTKKLVFTKKNLAQSIAELSPPAGSYEHLKLTMDTNANTFSECGMEHSVIYYNSLGDVETLDVASRSFYTKVVVAGGHSPFVELDFAPLTQAVFDSKLDPDIRLSNFFGSNN